MRSFTIRSDFGSSIGVLVDIRSFYVTKTCLNDANVEKYLKENEQIKAHVIYLVVVQWLRAV